MKIVILISMLLFALNSSNVGANNLLPLSDVPSINEVAIASPTQLSLRNAQKICYAYINQYPKYEDRDVFKEIEAKTVKNTGDGAEITGKLTYSGTLGLHTVDFKAKVKVDAYDNIIVNFNYYQDRLFWGWSTNKEWRVVSVY